jgi:hypothetical protein
MVENEAINDQTKLVSQFCLTHQTPTFWFVVSIFQYFQVFDKTLCTIGLQPILWIPNAHGIKQCMQKESIVHLHQLGNHTYEKHKQFF